MSCSIKPEDIIARIKNEHIKFIDCRFTDLLGSKHHFTIPSSAISASKLIEGFPFDGSSLPGWKGIQSSDMILIPALKTAMIDPFCLDKTMVLICNVIDPLDGNGYSKDPRTIAQRAEQYLKSSQIGDLAFFGPELEFFIFDHIDWHNEPCHSSYKIDYHASSRSIANSQHAYYNKLKSGYMHLPPFDSTHEIRSSMSRYIEEAGIPVEIHHHEVSSIGQCEIGTKYSTLTERSDWIQVVKYIIRNTAHQAGKTVTFMPKPIVGENGSGMHCHQSIWKDGKNLFSGNEYIGLSQEALYYIGGILKHIKALNAFTNPTVNSYKRLIPGYEAPVKACYSARNRSVAIRIPYSPSDNAKRIETRFPDALANPYLAQAALLMAGIDGIINKIDPGSPQEKNMYSISPEEDALVPNLATSLDEAINALDQDRQFLTQSGVFGHDLIDAYIDLKKQEASICHQKIDPVEFDLYYNG